ncbi:MAG TPA: hypothetical protein VFN22_05520 [Gemmatimonadales bacterium]|nr:hypothetical protein [Gemmatimonadales bacterium]
MRGFALPRLPRAALALLAVPLLGISCPSSEPLCPQPEPPFAVRARFFDGPSNTLLTGPTPGELQDGAYRDSLRADGYNGDGLVTTMAAGQGRTGTYRLTAKRDGYAAYAQSGLRVRSEGCLFGTITLEVQLQPE